MVKIIDNFLDEDLIKHLEFFYSFRSPHFYGQHSRLDVKKQIWFYYSELNLNDNLTQFLHNKIKKQVGFNKVISAFLNIQFKGMNGIFHSDRGNNTIVLMITKTLKKGSGTFEIKENNIVKKIDFVQNRLLCFDAKKLHRGLAPKENNTPRITMAFQTI